MQNMSLNDAIKSDYFNCLPNVKAVLGAGTQPTKDSLDKDSLDIALKTNCFFTIEAVLDAGAQPTKDSLDIAFQLNRCNFSVDIVKAVLDAGAQPTEHSPALAREFGYAAITAAVDARYKTYKSKCEIEKNAQELKRHGDNPATLFGTLPQDLNLEIAKRTRDYSAHSEQQAHDIAVKHFFSPKA